MHNAHHGNHKPALATRPEKAQLALSIENETRSVMKVGFIGAGNVTATIGRHLINAGRTIVVSNSRQSVIELINSTGLVAIDLGPLRTGGAMQELGAPLSGIEFHFVQRLHRR
jgi:hypothetical protein